jgi:hypothetical protein
MRIAVAVALALIVCQPAPLLADPPAKTCRRGCKAPFIACGADARAALAAALDACAGATSGRAACRRDAKRQAKDAHRACKGERSACRSCCRMVAAGECPDECGAFSGSIGPDGGSLAYCGARLDVLPGAVAAATAFRIERVEPPATLRLPLDWGVSGPAYRFAPADLALANWVRITLPHGQPGRVVAPFAVVAGDQTAFVEPCNVGDASVAFDGLALGTYLPLHETVDYPSSVSGLGGGEASAHLAGETIVFDLDDPPSYAVHIVDESELAVEISGTRPTEPPRMLRLAMRWNPSNGEASIAGASLAVFEGGELTLWSDVFGTGSVAMTPTGTDAYQGSATIPVRNLAGDDDTLAVEFTITTERWRWPFELACAAGFE